MIVSEGQTLWCSSHRHYTPNGFGLPFECAALGFRGGENVLAPYACGIVGEPSVLQYIAIAENTNDVCIYAVRSLHNTQHSHISRTFRTEFYVEVAQAAGPIHVVCSTHV